MTNTPLPGQTELPTGKQLVRSTLIAAASALVLLYTVVLPAEYGVDPSGIGRVLGLTEMGEIKVRLAREAAADASVTQAAPAPPVASSPDAVTAPARQPGSQATPPAAQTSTMSGAPLWRDEMSITLAPGEGKEIKLTMKQGEKAAYAWSVQGGVVNFDTHGDGSGRSISYEKGRAVAADEGDLVAAFSGNHGWFWRNRGKAEVTVVLRTRGEYSDIKRVK